MISLSSTRSRATVALVAFAALWLGGWALGYLFSRNIEFLWVPAATLGGTALWVGVVGVVYKWIYHAETDRQADRISGLVRSLRDVEIKFDPARRGEEQMMADYVADTEDHR